MAAEVLALSNSSTDHWVSAFGFFMQALVRLEGGDHERASELATEACHAVDARFSGPLMLLGNIALMRGDQEQAAALFDESIEFARRYGDIWALGILLPTAAGLKDRRRALTGSANATLRGAVVYCEQLDDRRGMAWCLDVFAGAQAAGGAAEAASRLWGAADALLESVGGSLNPSIGWIELATWMVCGVSVARPHLRQLGNRGDACCCKMPSPRLLT